MKSLLASVKAKILELRFPFAGKVSWVGVAVGDQVKKGQALAKLNTQILAKRHQKELADYEKIRAGFEAIKQKLSGSSDPDKKYLLDQSQADLNRAVLAVELADYQLKRATLTAPAAGVIAANHPFHAGMNISPASFSMLLIVSGSFYVSAKLPQQLIGKVKKDQLAVFKATAVPGQTYSGRVLRISPLPPDGRSTDFAVIVVLENYDQLKPGMVGKVKLRG